MRWVIIPDTQVAIQDYPELTNAQTAWIAANQVAHTFQVGDGVEWPREADRQRLRTALTPIFDTLSFAPGNHDMDEWDNWATTGDTSDRSVDDMNRVLPLTSFAGVVDSFPLGRIDNYAQTFSRDGYQFLVINLKYNPTDAEIAWADGVLSRFPNHNAVVNTHDFMAGTVFSMAGDRIWKMAKLHANMRFIFNGHFYPMAGQQILTGDNFNKVAAVMIDLQDYSNKDPNGFLQILDIDLVNGTIRGQTYSPALNQYRTERNFNFTLSGFSFIKQEEVVPVPLKRWPTADVGPIGEVLAEIMSYCPVADKLWISSGRDSLSEHGYNSLHNEGAVSYNNSPCAAIDYVANAPNTNWDTTEWHTVMRDASAWLEQYAVHINELIHTTPFPTDNGYYVKDGVVYGDCGWYGCSSDPKSVAAEHADHGHFGTNLDAANRILALVKNEPAPTPTPPVVTPPTTTGSVLFGYDGSDFSHVMDFTGLSFVTHKLTEAVSSGEIYEHTQFAPVMDKAKSQGVPFLGAYVVPRSGGFTPSQEADVAIAALYRQAPWLMQFDGFFWQVDLEKWPYDAVAAGEGTALADALHSKTGKPVVLYASKGQYGDSIPGSNVLWNANYNGSGSSRNYREMYSGDSGAGWVTYSGRMPLIWQYCSDGVFADGQKGDANAFRGTVNDFRRLILGQSVGDEDELTPEQSDKLDLIEKRLENIEHGVYHTMLGDDAPTWHMGNPPNPNDVQVVANVPANQHRALLLKVDALAAAVQQLSAKLNAQP